MTKPSDERLVQRVAAGDEQAFTLLYDRYAVRLLSFCRYILGSRDEAQDAVQQTFMRAHRAIVAGTTPSELRPWLYTVARNRCRTMLASRRERDLPVEALDRHAALDGLADEVQRREDLRELVQDLDRLPEAQRSALVLFELGDLSQRDVAGVLGVPEGKVKALVHQARTHLIAERAARERSCDDVRAELAVARGAALRRGPLRRHVRGCPACRAWQADVGRQRAALALVLPVALVGSRDAALTALGVGAAGAGAGAAAAGGTGAVGAGLATKVVAVVAALGVGAAGTEVAVESARDPKPAHSTPRQAKPVAQRTPPRAPAAAPAATPVLVQTAAPARRKAAVKTRNQRRALAKRQRALAKRQRALAKRQKAEAVKPGKRLGHGVVVKQQQPKALKAAKAPKRRAKPQPPARGHAKPPNAPNRPAKPPTGAGKGRDKHADG